METIPTTNAGRTDEQRGEDAAYTINHAIACTATDVGIAPYVSHGVMKKFFHSHGSLWEWFASEGIGDIAAVPVTIAIERLAPGMTQSLRKGMEKGLGWAFKKSSRREAQSWAKSKGFEVDSKEAKDREQQIYSYEIEHLPQAAIWTATSLVFNVATQKLFHNHLHKGHGHHHGHTVLEITGAVIAGKTVSTGAVIGLRAVFPDKAHQWDNFSSRHVFAPITKATDRLLGRKTERADNWEQRISASQQSEPALTVTARG